MASTMSDVYPNKGYAVVTESAANTLTFSEIQTNVSIFEKVAWLLQRIEWYFTYATYALLGDSGDTIDAALCSSNQITALSLSNPGVIDLMTMYKLEASDVGYNYQMQPLVRDFGSLGGGGLLIAPRPLYVGIKGTGVASVATAACRFYFKQIQLKPDEYLELIDFYRLVQ